MLKLPLSFNIHVGQFACLHKIFLQDFHLPQYQPLFQHNQKEQNNSYSQYRYGNPYKPSLFVFTYKDKKIGQCSTKAWSKALKRAGISNFRWHDLRHTWASWHVQNRTSLQELQQLGGWASFEMVLRYAHLSSDHLRSAANRINAISVTKQGAGN